MPGSKLLPINSPTTFTKTQWWVICMRLVFIFVVFERNRGDPLTSSFKFGRGLGFQFLFIFLLVDPCTFCSLIITIIVFVFLYHKPFAVRYRYTMCTLDFPFAITNQKVVKYHAKSCDFPATTQHKSVGSSFFCFAPEAVLRMSFFKLLLVIA